MNTQKWVAMAVMSGVISGVGLGAVAQVSTQTMTVPVVSTEPIVSTITERIPHESCRDQRVKVVRADYAHSSTPVVMGTIIGALAAGALGHNSQYQPLIAGTGAVLGASIGNDVAHQRHARAEYVTEKHCEIDYELRDRSVVVGYRVGYQYGDTIYHTRTESRPGPTINVRVRLEPLD